MAKTNTGLVSFAQAAAAAGWGYVFGTFGQLCDVALLDRQSAAYPDGNLAGGRMRTVGNKWIGRRVCDCSGIIKAYFWMEDINSAPEYNAQQDGVLASIYNNATERGPISALPEISGLALQLPGHVGVYIGNGEVIEAKGTEYGVVKSRLADNNWQTWAKIPGIEYVCAAPAPAPTSAPASVPASAGNIVAIGTVVGIDVDSCLNMWREPDKTKGATGVSFHNGDKLNILRWDVSDWYQVEHNGTVGWVASVYVAAQQVATVPAPAVPTIHRGGKVRVINAINYDTGNVFGTYYSEYDVIEVSGDRVVIGIGGTVTAAVKASNLQAL